MGLGCSSLIGILIGGTRIPVQDCSWELEFFLKDICRAVRCFCGRFRAAILWPMGASPRFSV